MSVNRRKNYVYVTRDMGRMWNDQRKLLGLSLDKLADKAFLNHSYVKKLIYMGPIFICMHKCRVLMIALYVDSTKENDDDWVLKSL